MSLPNLLPELSDEDYQSLKDSIAEHGFWPAYPVVLDENDDILDGFHRDKACRELGIEPTTTVLAGLSDWEKLQVRVKANTHRRQLSPAQRRQLLKRLIEVHEADMKRAEIEAKKAGGRKGAAAKAGKVSGETKGDNARAAAADASATPFDQSVVAGKAPAEKVDSLAKYAKLTNTSRATVARDKQVLDRMEAIEKAARKQKRDDVLRALDGKHPALDTLEREVGLREPLPEVPDETDEDRREWVAMLAEALGHLQPRLTAAEADILIARTGGSLGSLFIQLRNITADVADRKDK